MIDTPTDDVRALRTMLPAPDVAELSDAARTRIEDTIWSQLTPAPPARTRSRRIKVGVLVTAAAAALVLVPAVLLPGDDSGRTVIGASPAAARVLDEAASAALRDDVAAPSEKQWVYVRSVWTVAKPGPDDRPRTDRQIWLSQEPRLRNGENRFIERGSKIPIYYDMGTTELVPADVNRPTYAWLAALPTDPDELRTRLVDDLKRDAYYEDEFDLYGTIRDVISENIVPPKVQAALYRVLMQIEGVTTTADVTDAVGRHGVGITMSDSRGSLVDTLIFDRSTHALLGSRTGGDASAVLQRAVVDERYEQPAR